VDTLGPIVFRDLCDYVLWGLRGLKEWRGRARRKSRYLFLVLLPLLLLLLNELLKGSAVGRVLKVDLCQSQTSMKNCGVFDHTV
jgi:hypothetical protein